MTTYRTIESIAAFLAHNYGLSDNPAANEAFLNTLDSDFTTTSAIANENRVWTNVVATIAESRQLLTLLNQTNRKHISLTYLTQQAQAIKDKQQLKEINECPTLHGQRLILMKGATRLYDQLFPSAFHRQMSDIDIYIGQQDSINSFAEMGYEVMDESQGNIGDIDSQFIAGYSLANHHLPAIFNPKYSKRVELHLFFVQRFIHIEMRAKAVDDAQSVPNTKCLMTLHPLDQLILLIIHSRFADRSAYFSSSRLRGLVEGMLIYRKLSDVDRTAFDHHFRAAGVEREIRLWKYLCYRLFNAREFAELDGMSMRLRYWWHTKTGHSGWALSIAYAFRSVHLLVTHRLRSPIERKQFFQRLFDGYRWRRYFRRVTRIR